MKGLPLSRAASGLVRALLQRVDDHRHRILLSSHRSTEWHSLTFTGERHVLTLRISGSDAGDLAHQLTNGLADAEFNLQGHLVADIEACLSVEAETRSVLVTIEALTIVE